MVGRRVFVRDYSSVSTFIPESVCWVQGVGFRNA